MLLKSLMHSKNFELARLSEAEAALCFKRRGAVADRFLDRAQSLCLQGARRKFLNWPGERPQPLARCGAGSRHARRPPDDMRVTVDETRHHHATRGVDFVGLPRQGKGLHAAALTYFLDLKV